MAILYSPLVRRWGQYIISLALIKLFRHVLTLTFSIHKIPGMRISLALKYLCTKFTYTFLRVFQLDIKNLRLLSVVYVKCLFFSNDEV